MIISLFIYNVIYKFKFALQKITRNTWWASAGLDRGQIKIAQKIAFNPNLGQRDF